MIKNVSLTQLTDLKQNRIIDYYKDSCNDW